MVETMHSPESKNSSGKAALLATDIELPVFASPQIERWPMKISWGEAMRLLEPSRVYYMRHFDSPEKRWSEKNPEPFVWP